MSFGEIIGQERAIQILRKAIENQRLAHAYLFVGIEGVGKKSTALALVQALNCPNYMDRGDACGDCPSCKKIAQNQYPDLIIIEPEEEIIKISQIRELQGRLRLKLYEGKKKVCIIPFAEKMSPAASNALLKILEEPPLDTIFILITSRINLLFSTVISRCQKIRFQPLPSSSILAVIKKKGGMEERWAKLITSLSGGSLGKALELSDQLFFKEWKKLIQEISNLREKGINHLFQMALDFSSEKEHQFRFLELLKTWVRDILVYKEEKEEERIINWDLLKEIKESANSLDFSWLWGQWRAINEAQLALARNSNPQLVLEAMLLRFYSKL